MTKHINSHGSATKEECAQWLKAYVTVLLALEDISVAEALLDEIVQEHLMNLTLPKCRELEEAA
jgi:hypothetical protein